MTTERKCPVCGSKVQGHHLRRFCSGLCSLRSLADRAKARRLKSRPLPEGKACKRCGKALGESTDLRRLYCSRKCRSAEDRKNHRERVRKTNRAWASRNKEKIRLYASAYWQRHLARLRQVTREKAAKRRRENPEKAKSVSRSYYARNRASISGRRRAKYQREPDRWRAKSREYYHLRQEEMIERERIRRLERNRSKLAADLLKLSTLAEDHA